MEYSSLYFNNYLLIQDWFCVYFRSGMTCDCGFQLSKF